MWMSVCRPCCDSCLDLFVVSSIETHHFPSCISLWERGPPAEVRNRTLPSMWFELGPLKLWRTPRMTWGTHTQIPICWMVEEKCSPGILRDILAQAGAIKTGRKPITQGIMTKYPMKSASLSHTHTHVQISPLRIELFKLNQRKVLFCTPLAEWNSQHLEQIRHSCLSASYLSPDRHRIQMMHRAARLHCAKAIQKRTQYLSPLVMWHYSS